MHCQCSPSWSGEQWQASHIRKGAKQYHIQRWVIAKCSTTQHQYISRETDANIHTQWQGLWNQHQYQSCIRYAVPIIINVSNLPGSPVFVVHWLQTSAPAHPHDYQLSQQGEKMVSATIHSIQHRMTKGKAISSISHGLQNVLQLQVVFLQDKRISTGTGHQLQLRSNEHKHNFPCCSTLTTSPKCHESGWMLM